MLNAVELTDKRDTICKTLSRGMTQRLVLAKTLIHRPRVMILDEPASGMDPMSRIALRQTLRSLARDGTTILASSHILSELAEMCTSLGILVKGKLVISGTAAEVRQKLGGGTRVIEITVLEESHGERAAAFLTGLPGIAGLKWEKLHLRFDLAGDEREQAALLTRLVQEGVAVRAGSRVSRGQWSRKNCSHCGRLKAPDFRRRPGPYSPASFSSSVRCSISSSRLSDGARRG